MKLLDVIVGSHIVGLDKVLECTGQNPIYRAYTN